MGHSLSFLKFPNLLTKIIYQLSQSYILWRLKRNLKIYQAL
ncbi:hypothetical protein LEP1GSC056_1581 [Leptospira borgpetersenii str. Brem 328]|uniref:SLEI domain protein, PF07620 family n=1 Tax=Leptospira borgpetersenii str. Brem 328 TaxID=1049780 RepID=A0ABC9SKK3_LEPBO|nr:hypothetical protein LEP1GSC056_1581 [Leptospira borgpetersenii str. Brem 328]